MFMLLELEAFYYLASKQSEGHQVQKELLCSAEAIVTVTAFLGEADVSEWKNEGFCG